MNTPWISIAKQWLIKNAPCDKLIALEQISTKMPLSIRQGRRGRVMNRTRLAAEAISRCYEIPFRELPKILEALPPEKRRRRFKGVAELIRQLASRHEGASVNEIKEEAQKLGSRNGISIARQLKMKKQLTYDGKVFRVATYTTNGVINNE